LWARGAVGSALEWHSRGQGFESPRVHQIHLQNWLSTTQNSRSRKSPARGLEQVAYGVHVSETSTYGGTTCTYSADIHVTDLNPYTGTGHFQYNNVSVVCS
jgi:hypothetical protein